MPAEPGEVERLAVDQELRAVDLHGANAHGLLVAVDHLITVDQFDHGGVQVAVARGPQVRVRHPKLTGRPGAGRHLGAVGVQQPHPHLGRAVAGDVDRVYTAVVELVDGDEVVDVAHVRGRRGVQPHLPVQAGEVVEVVKIDLPTTLGGVVDDARRNRLEGQFVVHHRGDAHLLAGFDQAGDVGLERRVAARMRHHLDAVHPHHRGVRGRIEAQHDALPGPATRHDRRGLVPGVANVVAALGAGTDVVVAGRHRHLTRVGQRGREPLVATSVTGGVETERPQAAQRFAFAGGGVLGSQHRCSLFRVSSSQCRGSRCGSTNGCHHLSWGRVRRSGRPGGRRRSRCRC